MPDDNRVWAMPLRVRGGVLVTCDADSPEHVAAQVEMVVRTPLNTFEYDPDFGVAEVIGTTDPIAPVYTSALEKFIPEHPVLTTEEVDEVNAHIRYLGIQI